MVSIMELFLMKFGHQKNLFEKHCQMPHIVKFFESECLDENGLVEKWNVNLFE